MLRKSVVIRIEHPGRWCKIKTLQRAIEKVVRAYDQVSFASQCVCACVRVAISNRFRVIRNGQQSRQPALLN